MTLRILRQIGLALGVLFVLAACKPLTPASVDRGDGGLSGGPVQTGDPTLNIPVSQPGWENFTNRSTRVYLNRSTSSGRLATLPKGTVVDVFGKNSGWTLVNYGGQQRGWVRSSYLGRRVVKRTVKRKPARPKVVRPKRGGKKATPKPAPAPDPDVIAGGDAGGGQTPAAGGGAAALPGE